MSKNKRIILIIVGIVTVSGLIINFVIERNKNDNLESGQVAKEEIVKEISDVVGGLIIKDGYNISYESGKDRLIITVTNDPFLTNQKKAENFLESEDINLCNINYLVLGGNGVTLPEEGIKLKECD